MQAYAQYDQLTFTFELAQALSDPNHVYWAQDELNRALDEALLAWGALTSYWTTSAIFNTAASTPFYDLSAQLPSLRSRAYNFGNLVPEIQYSIFEPPSGTSGAGMTTQFTIVQITKALVRRRNQFVIDSRIPLTFGTFPAPAPVSDLMPLDPSVALIARAAWRDGVTGITTPLRRSDTFAAQSLNPVWNLDARIPYSYSQAEAMPGNIILLPPPQASGAAHLVYAQTLDLAVADNTSFAVPDEFAWALKYGAMHDLFSTNSEGYDPIRSRYCLERYTAAVELAGQQRSLLRVRSNNTPLTLGTLADLDAGKPYWQTGSGAPQVAACAYDLLAFYRVPNGVYSITCDVSQTAPLPSAPTDFIQVGREELSYIFDYCRHILMLKVGGVEFVQSMPLYDNFLKGAAQRNKLIAAKARYLTPLFTVPSQQESESNAA